MTEFDEFVMKLKDRTGLPDEVKRYIEPDSSLNLSENFLYMLTGRRPNKFLN